MSEKSHSHLASQWVRLGVLFNAAPARQPVDVERLLLNTARTADTNPAIFVLAVSWLAANSKYVAKHRLARLIENELEKDHRPTMGLMLDLVREKSRDNNRRYNRAIAVCGTAIDERPLMVFDRQNDAFIRLSRQNASALSSKWGRWIEDFELKTDAIRPMSWIVRKNPDLYWRGVFNGDLRASIWVELGSNSEAGDSKSELARACGATRAAVIDAIKGLELSGQIVQRKIKNRLTVRRKLNDAA